MRPVILFMLCCIVALMEGCSVRPDQAALSQATPTSAGTAPTPAPTLSVGEALLERLSGMTPEQAVAVKDGWGMAGVAVFCLGTAPSPEETVLACQWGPGYNAMQDGRALFWREGGAWKSQPYPPEGVHGVGDFRRLRRDGDLLQVVMNVSRGQTRLVEQVGLLRYEGGRWQAVWGPDVSAPHADLSLAFQPPEGIGWFTLFRDEGTLHIREDWVRTGVQYVRRSRAELSQTEYVAVRFVLALLSNTDVELAFWATPEALQAAQRLDMASALRGGFTTHPGEGGTVRLEPAGGGRSWRITVVRDAAWWKVTGIE